MRFAVQILNFINFKVTFDALRSIIDTGYKDLHIYVLDNGSSNDSIKQIERYIDQEKLDFFVFFCSSTHNLGFSGGHNYLYEWINLESKKCYQFHLILNSDALIPKNFFSKVVKQYDNEIKHYPLYGFAIHDPYDPSQSSVIQSWNKFFAFARKHTSMPLTTSNFAWQYYPSGAALLIDPKHIDNFSLFDKNLFLYGEEVDLVFKFQHKGLAFKIFDDIKITHSFGQSTFDTKKKRNCFNDYYYQRSKILLMKKYYPLRIFFVRLTFLPIIVWRVMAGYPKHVKLLLRLFFSSLSKISSNGYLDDGYFNLDDLLVPKRGVAKHKIKHVSQSKKFNSK
jgi:GT2 family glycosyltransferase